MNAVLSPELFLSLKRSDIERRKAGCVFVARVGHLLSLSQLTVSTAQILFHQSFSGSVSVVEHAGGCLFLACKVQESSVSFKALISAMYYIYTLFHGDSFSVQSYSSAVYMHMRQAIIDAELSILASIGFRVQLHLPYGYLANYISTLGLPSHEHICQKAWNYLNDMMLTVAVVIYPPPTLAATALWMTFRDVGFEIQVEDLDWLHVFDATAKDAHLISQLVGTSYDIQVEPSHLASRIFHET